MNNICKFPNSSWHSPLLISCFVMETDERVMKRSFLLKEHRMILVMQGQGTIQFNERTFPVRAGTLLFGFENERFEVRQVQDMTYLYIDFHGGRAEELFHRFDIHRGNRVFEGYEGLIPLWRDSLSRADGDTIDLASESILLYSFSRLSPYTAQGESIVSKILSITEKEFDDPELSIKGIAESISYNAKYLSHAFKKAMNVTYSEYLRDLRVKYAITLFNEGLDSVKNVALLSGFSDPLYFSNIFKKTVGLAPREYVLAVQRKHTEA